MVELPQYVAMAPDEYHYHRGNGNISMGSVIDCARQPGVVGMWRRKPVFLYVNPQEQAALESGDIESYFIMRGYKEYVMTNDPIEGPKTSIP